MATYDGPESRDSGLQNGGGEMNGNQEGQRTLMKILSNIRELKETLVKRHTDDEQVHVNKQEWELVTYVLDRILLYTLLLLALIFCTQLFCNVPS